MKRRPRQRVRGRMPAAFSGPVRGRRLATYPDLLAMQKWKFDGHTCLMRLPGLLLFYILH